MPKPLILAIRNGRAANDAIEVLCLRRIESSLFRLFTTTLDAELQELDDDLLPVDFDNAYDPKVTTLLIESFWRIDVSESDVDVACRLLDGGICDAEVDLSGCSGESLRCFGPLLVSLLDQLATVRVTHLGASAMIGRIGRTLAILAALPYLNPQEDDAIEKARRSVIALEAELKINRLAGDI